MGLRERRAPCCRVRTLPRGSPETVNIGVALQVEWKTGILAIGAVGVIVLFSACFFDGAAPVWLSLDFWSCYSSS